MSDNKEPAVMVRFDKDSWIVHNDGDSAILFSAPEKELALKFAEEMARQHDIDLVVQDEKDNHDKQVPPSICVEHKNDSWIVYNCGDSAILFTAPEKDDAVKFAKEMADRHDIPVNLLNGDDDSQLKEKPVKLRINVEHRGANWVVKRADDSSTLYSSPYKDEAMEYVEELAKDQEIDLHVDRS